MSIHAAIAQHPPVLLNLNASLARAVEIIEEAAAQNTQLLLFPEAFLPGYPTWIWRLRPGGDMSLGNEIHQRLLANAVNLDAGDLDPICEAAARNQMVVVIGFNERESRYSGSTLFNSLAIINSDGQILNHHRKMMPTNPERMVWGMGDASGLRVVETAVGRIGGLICWENYMPLARYALYAQEIDILLAPTWDSGDTWIASMNHIAREGGCWVLSTATAMQGNDIPQDVPGRDKLFSDQEWINPGDAVIIKPFGGIVAGPLHQEKAILYADIDVAQARHARKALDVTGHYARPDLFRLEVDRSPRPPVQFKD